MKKKYLNHPILFTVLTAIIIHILILILLETAFTWFNLSRDLEPLISKYLSMFYPAIVSLFIGIAFLVNARKQQRSALRLLNNAAGILSLIVAFMTLQGAALLL